VGVSAVGFALCVRVYVYVCVCMRACAFAYTAEIGMIIASENNCNG